MIVGNKEPKEELRVEDERIITEEQKMEANLNVNSVVRID